MEGGQASRFRGVISRRTGKWEAQITVDRKRLWLGTYETEVDAAIAYDRASLKLLRFSSLNFPFTVRTPLEMQFQSMYPFETIISMIKNRTYAYFLGYKANLARSYLPGVRSGQRRIVNAGIGGGPRNEVHEPVMLFGARIG
ncbi:hypothetical protein BVRB_2g032900 [Beta vulgaris subsp. vulgaris]|nr:hypothetical protein BVRB_2g032900 [Beta vulgaris subsp. vulgaris]